jgi:hypothetical protein
MIQENELERAVMTMLLTGDHPTLQQLREQYDAASLSKRELTGVGFFADFSVPQGVPQLHEKRGFYIGDVIAEIVGLKHGAGFVLHIDSGKISFLEGYSYDEPWPGEIRGFKLRYHPSNDKRDLAFLDAH